jgi:hypothetical protein
MLPDLEIAVRLLVAATLGSLIGFERERLLVLSDFCSEAPEDGGPLIVLSGMPSSWSCSRLTA